MVHIKRMNESFFAQILKDFNVAGELVRARQEEKQGLLDEFDAECKRFFFGKISERALASSVKKTNKELVRLDKNVRESIARARNAGERAVKLTSEQAPVGYRATLSGISGGEKKKKAKRKTAGKTSKKKKR
ncbi:MAG: hypothetical protein Q8P81_02465 [Nanoarchaeota archaeon]|nr:hypothetical protein [Nanoarchaeota archaeon]